MKLFSKYIFIISLSTNYVDATESYYSGQKSFREMTNDSIKKMNELVEYCKNNPCQFKRAVNKYYIRKNIDGKFIILDDSSVYQVYDFDVVTATYWMESDEILISEDKMINLDERETIEVYRIK